MDRPPRKTKLVNYREEKDFDDDDEDFACAKAPPSKRAREDVKQECKKTRNTSSSQESNSQSRKSRRPLDERLHDRDLEAAITLSLLNNTDGTKDHQYPTSKGGVEIQVPADENTDPASLLRSNCSIDLEILGLDEITSDKGSLALPRQRKAPTNTTEEPREKPTDEDDDYVPKLTADSESDDDFSEAADSEDEEFTVKKVDKVKKKETGNKNGKSKPPPASKREKQPSKPSKSKSQAAASTTVRSPPTAKPSSSSASTLKPAVSLSPVGGRVPKWTPPAQIGRSPSSSQNPAAKSPGQGLRLGLSRLVRVKPLHPSVTSH